MEASSPKPAAFSIKAINPNSPVMSITPPFVCVILTIAALVSLMLYGTPGSRMCICIRVTTRPKKKSSVTRDPHVHLHYNCFLPRCFFFFFFFFLMGRFRLSEGR